MVDDKNLNTMLQRAYDLRAEAEWLEREYAALTTHPPKKWEDMDVEERFMKIMSHDYGPSPFLKMINMPVDADGKARWGKE